MKINIAEEIKRSMEEFGRPITIISNNKPCRGLGLFSLITTKNKTAHNLPEIEKINLYDKKKYSVWVYCYRKLNQIEKIIDNTIGFLVISGFFDDQIKCWRLIVTKDLNQKNNTEKIEIQKKNENLNLISEEKTHANEIKEDEENEEEENEENEEEENED